MRSYFQYAALHRWLPGYAVGIADRCEEGKGEGEGGRGEMVG
jgi:hypothetical protein